ncbi:MAG: alpha/beta fold hydrolase [Xanthobacteraceae bacterium]|nr:alpha/beta fold hydrolase [Xanthobacteraceae bacterium]
MDGARAVMDAAGMERAALLGISEGGPMAALFAATYPQRCLGLALYGSFARASSWDDAGGTGAFGVSFSPKVLNEMWLLRRFRETGRMHPERRGLNRL